MPSSWPAPAPEGRCWRGCRQLSQLCVSSRNCATRALPRAGHGTLALESSFHDAASRSILAVGEGGLGFIVEIDEERLVITAAHCLPRSPTPGSPDCEELLFSELLGPLGRTRTVTSKCLFYDPVSDLAVLGTPGILLSEAYDQLMAAATPLPIGKVRGRFGGESRG